MIGVAVRGRCIDSAVLMNEIVAMGVSCFGKGIEIEALLDNLSECPVGIGQVMCRQSCARLALADAA